MDAHDESATRHAVLTRTDARETDSGQGGLSTEVRTHWVEQSKVRSTHPVRSTAKYMVGYESV